MIDKFYYDFLNRVYSYDDYTQQEINSKLIQKIDEVIEECNNAFEFVDWLKEQGVPDEVQNILFAMLENDSLKDIFNVKVYNNLKTEIDNLKTEIDNLKIEINKLKIGLN